MANNQEAMQVCSLPLPPVQYFQNYSDENIRRGRASKPPPIIQETYTMFGNPYNAEDSIIRPLESQGFKRLYPQHFDRRRELRKLNHSLLVNFLDLLDLLIQCPDSPRRAEKVDDISLLFIHIHHLLNEFRPHQARETVRVMLDLQRRQRNETTIRLQKHIDKVSDILQQTLENLPDTELDSKLMVDTSKIDRLEQKNADEPRADKCVPKDKLMCHLIDTMNTN
ncbi:PREDICTED: mediator of RNA polymerase II transcription subunit 7 [Diuraphis noxia]|uniref:mediator of RNA polymerase II transcription subunit 7 n=1 Tax=Diuraphis noxia TaxID=143948 RepID=UPI0007639133|nr:PREDICTED: mediator of RNA polymerase II transcription subunit 7 [Diuraphis noxia]